MAGLRVIRRQQGAGRFSEPSEHDGREHVVKRRSLRYRPRPLKIRQEQSPPPTQPADGSDPDLDFSSDSSDDEEGGEDDDDGFDSPSPTSTTFPSGVSGSDDASLPSQTNTSGPAQSLVEDPSSTPTPDPDLASSTKLPASESTPTAGATSGAVQEPAADDGTRKVDGTLGVAFGVIGLAAILLCVGVLVWWLLRRRSRRRAQSQTSSQRPPSGQWLQTTRAVPPPNPRRASSSLMGELMDAAYDAENGQVQQQYHPRGHNSWAANEDHHEYYAEKGMGESHQPVVQQPAPVAQPTGYQSVSEWVRRLNPLRMHPCSERTSMSSTPEQPVMRSPNDDPYAVDDTEALVRPPLATQPSGGPAVFQPLQQSYLGDSRGQHEIRSSQNQRVQSVAVTEYTTVSGAETESSWKSWGGGAMKPRNALAPPPPAAGQTLRGALAGKFAKLGGRRHG